MRVLPTVLLLATVATAQQPFNVLAALQRGAVAGDRHDGKLAFDGTASLLRVQVRVGDQACAMLLDTGATMAVTPEFAKAHHLAVLGTHVTHDKTGRSRDLQFVALPAVEFAGVRFTDLAAVVVDLRAIPLLRESDIDGVVGTNLLRLGALAIDYGSGSLAWSDDVTRLSPVGTRVPFTTSPQGCPMLQLRLGSNAAIDCELDTGSNAFVEVPMRGLDLPARRIGVHGSTSAGAFGSVREGSSLCWWTDVRVGELRLPDMVVDVDPEGSARLGNRFFERTRLVIDWRGGELWVDDPARLGLAQLRTHGLGLQYEADVVKVATVVAGSAAARAGLEPGQRVLAVADVDLRTGALPDFVRAVALLRDQARDAVAVTIERDGKPVVLELALERLLP